jgi:hypothetical protein
MNKDPRPEGLPDFGKKELINPAVLDIIRGRLISKIIQSLF